MNLSFLDTLSEEDLKDEYRQIYRSSGLSKEEFRNAVQAEALHVLNLRREVFQKHGKMIKHTRMPYRQYKLTRKDLVVAAYTLLDSGAFPGDF